jgi:hypothetical protein
MNDAIWGFIGVLVGAGVTLWTTYWTVSREHAASRVRDEHARALETLRSARLLVAELEHASATLRHVLDTQLGNREAMSAALRDLSLTAWEEHAPVLARGLHDDAWAQVHRAARIIRFLRQIGERPDSAPGVFTDPEARLLRDHLMKLYAAVTGVQRLASSKALPLERVDVTAVQRVD